MGSLRWPERYPLSRRRAYFRITTGGTLRRGAAEPLVAVPVTLAGHDERGQVTALLECRDQP
jgi:hypothetical protein